MKKGINVYKILGTDIIGYKYDPCKIFLIPNGKSSTESIK